MDVSLARGKAPLQQVITIGAHQLLADAPVASGGEATGPEPHDLLAAALAACTALTVTMYARHKQMTLDDVQVRISHGPQDGGYHFKRHITYIGTLSPEQRERLTQIAERCPVHRTLVGTVQIETVAA